MTTFNSPIEEKFYHASRTKIPGLIPQHHITANGHKYRLDFARIIVDRNTGRKVLKVAIELDGYQYHSTKEQRNHDVQRDRDLMADGWQVIRFTGTHINKDVDKCVDEAAGLIDRWAREKGAQASRPGRQQRRRFRSSRSTMTLIKAVAVLLLAIFWLAPRTHGLSWMLRPL
jgi:hypothetical protein